MIKLKLNFCILFAANEKDQISSYLADNNRDEVGDPG